MELKDVLFEVQDGVGIITMNRPDRLNASSTDMTESMVEILKNLTPEVRAIVLTGAGRAFCSGGDVKGMSQRLESEEYWKQPHPERAVAMAFWNCDRPIIAAVNGHAVGIGLSYASMCDFRIASENAQFGAFWVRRGFMPDGGGTFFLPEILGTSKALELVWTGRPIDPQEALDIGLVTKVVPAEELMASSVGLARQLSKGATLAMGMAKRGMYKSRIGQLEAALEFESYGQAMLRQTDDHAEGVKAFIEKRTPVFKSR